MKKVFSQTAILLVLFISTTGQIFATDPAGSCPAGQTATANGCVPDDAPVNNGGSNILDVDNQSLRDGDVDMSTIPLAIVSIINALIGIAGTISVFALIYYAVRMQLASGITGDSSRVDNAKKGMVGALVGFILAILAWFIVARIVDFLTQVS